MNWRETWKAIEEGGDEDRRRALLELSSVVCTLSEAVLELAGKERLNTGVDPLTYRSRAILSGFIELDN